MRLLFVTSTPPIPTWGGAMAFYRHFCERDDFQISVITDNPQILEYSVPYSYSLITPTKLWSRLARTRFSKTAHSWKHLFGGQCLPVQIRKQAEDFDPDVVLTVAGSWSWTAQLARNLAKHLQIPLVGSFNDWWYYNAIYTPWTKLWIENTFRGFYQQCDLALCTSEGMQKALGPHRNSVVLYPTGASIASSSSFIPHDGRSPFTVAFGGNLGEWYGRMLEDLITQANLAATEDSPLQFKIFGSNPSWSLKFDREVKEAGMYKGQVPFDQLKAEMQQVDALLLLMGFENSCAQIERTSFKTKFLDYLSFQKPILLWGPDYCSAVAIAKEFDSAEICVSPHATDFLDKILAVKADSNRQAELVTNAQRMYAERFHPDKIHEVFVSSMKALVASQ